MARFNTALTSSIISGTATIGTPYSGAFTEFTGTAPYTVTLPSPVLFPGVNQTFYNGTSGQVTLSVSGALFVGTGATGAATFVLNSGNVVSLFSNGTNYVVISEDGSPLTATTGSFSGNVTINGGSATLSATPQTVTLNPTSTSTIDNINIGVTTRGSGAFNTLTANQAVTFTANTASSGTGSGTLVVTGGLGVSGTVYAGAFNGNLTGTIQTAAQPNITSVGNLSTTGLTVDTTTLVVDAANDRVGIGTANPTTRLQVNNAADSRIIIFETGTTPYTATLELASQAIGTYGALLQYTSSAETLTLKAYGRTVTGTTQGSILFNTKVANTTDTTVMTIHGFRGNVGINSTAPDSKLTVEGSGTANESVVRFNNQGDYASRIWLRQSSRSAYISVSGSVGDTFATGSLPYGLLMGLSGNPSPVQFYTGSTGAVRMTIDTVGNVGIGVTSPTYKLHVDGTGAVSSLDINAISAQLGISAVDIFVYDTSKDSDGGAWRKRTQHTSWYNEALNSATRGARREFPSVAVIVATSATNGIIIYDGDSPDMPMWITYAYLSWDGPMRGISAVNGIIAGVFFGAINYSGNGLVLLDFIKDRQSRNYVSGYSNLKNGFVYELLSTTRVNTTYLTIGSDLREYTLASYNTNDVAMTVLPNAPVDPATGLPKPTIAVATYSGVSVIKDTDTVTNLGWSGAALRLSGFNLDNEFCAIYNNGNTIYNVKYKPPYNTQDTSENYYYNLAVAQGPSLPWNPTNERPIWGRKDEYVIGTIGVLRYLGKGIDGVPPTRTYSVQTCTYNSGYMVGDIKGAWLSDTSVVTASSTAIFSDDFSAQGGWSLTDGPTISGGVLTLANQTSSRATLSSWNGVTGKQYLGIINISSNAASGTFGLDDDGAGAGVGGVTGYKTFSGTGVIYFYFTKTASNRFRFIRNGGGPISITSFYVYETELDRSTNYQGLQVFGTITKAPVATGADLVAYSGFSTSNYLLQPYNSNLDFGTGDFSICLWLLANTANAGERQSLVDRVNSFYITREYTGRCYFGAGTGSYLYTTNSYTNGTMMFVAVRRSGVLYFYVNGVLDPVGGVANTNNVTNGTPATYIGVDNGLSASLWYCRDKLSLIRISGTAPTDAQILKIYEDEKYLFQENAKATLYGASDTVTALAYDTDTQLLHVGTSSGRSVFDGLRRVENTAIAVSAAISAANGLAAEN